MNFLLLYAAYVFGVYAFFVWVVPLLVFGTRFFALCVWESAKLAGPPLWWVLRTGLPLAFAAGRSALLFIIIFIGEWRRGDAPDGDHDDDEHDDDDHDHRDDNARALAQALALLGLGAGFTRDELRRAYKQAIMKAHPDAGGTAAMAAAVNGARDFLMREKDWS